MPVWPDRLEHAAHVRHGRVEVVGSGIDERHGDHDVGVVGPVDALVLLGDHDPVLHAHWRHPLADSREQVALAVVGGDRPHERSGEDPVLPRVRLGHLVVVDAEPPRRVRVDLGGVGPQRARPGVHVPGDVDPGRDAMVLSGPVEPLLLERRLALRRAGSSRGSPSSGPSTTPSSRASTGRTARPGRGTSRDRRHARRRAPRCRAPGGGRDAGSRAWSSP